MSKPRGREYGRRKGDLRQDYNQDAQRTCDEKRKRQIAAELGIGIVGHAQITVRIQQAEPNQADQQKTGDESERLASAPPEFPDKLRKHTQQDQ